MNQFLQLVYSSPGRAGLFLYTSDLAVLVAVLVRSVVDRPLSDPVFLVATSAFAFAFAHAQHKTWFHLIL